MISPSHAPFAEYQQSGWPGRAHCNLKSPFRIRLESFAGRSMAHSLVLSPRRTIELWARPFPGRKAEICRSPEADCEIQTVLLHPPEWNTMCRAKQLSLESGRAVQVEQRMKSRRGEWPTRVALFETGDPA